MPWEGRSGGSTPGPKCPKKLFENFSRPYSTSWSSYLFIFVCLFVCFFRIETGHEVLDELIGRCCGELSIIIYGDVLHGLSRIKTIIALGRICYIMNSNVNMASVKIRL